VKKHIAMLLALMMALSVFSGITVFAAGADTAEEEVNPYDLGGITLRIFGGNALPDPETVAEADREG
jgi:hypothetical protein